LGVLDGGLRDYPEQKLGAEAMKLALKLADFDAEKLSEILVGAAKQTSRPSNLARYTMLEARFPDTIPAYTVQRQSASGLQAVANGFWSVKNGMAEAILAGGAESMTHIPREIHNARFVFDRRSRIVFDPIPAQVAGAQIEDLTMELIRDRIAERYGISPEDLNSFVRAGAEKAAARGPADYICKMRVRRGKVFEAVEADEIKSAGGAMAGPADGAAMLLLASEASAKTPIAELLAVGVSAGDPSYGGLLGTEAVKKALGKAGVSLAELSRVEIVEMNAAQVLAALRELGLDMNDRRINPLGGGLATGSPWGASGAAHLVDLIHGLRAGQFGMTLNPAEGGQAVCAVVKRI
jgi:acetyl-CoA C-acetyltransferase